MKIILFFLIFLTLDIKAQEPGPYIASFDSKIYSLKTRGIKDFVVEVESSKLTRQVNEMMVFGNVKKLVFKVYWTANPERIAVEVLGLPEGFKEIKEELKVNVMAMLDNLIPLSTHNKFSGYQIVKGGTARELLAKDTSGVASIPSYVLKFDDRDLLVEVVGKKTIGTFKVVNRYEKPSITNGKWVLLSQVTTASENGQSLISKKELVYGTSNGMTVLSRIDFSSEQTWNNSETKPLVTSDSIDFKNYKIDTGEALKHFLGDTAKE